MRCPPVDNVSGVGNSRIPMSTRHAIIRPMFCTVVRDFCGMVLFDTVGDVALLTILIKNSFHVE